MMKRRHSPGPIPAGQDTALRAALFAAAESVEPADDGLARIRAKISESQTGPARRRFGRRVAGEPWWRSLLPPRGWLPAVAATVAERFRPDPNRAGWFGWLRPVAAVGTGLFVVTAAAVAVAALPAALGPSSATGRSVRPVHTKTHNPKHHRSPAFTSSGSGSTGPSGQSGGSPTGSPQPTGTPTCSPSGSPSTSPSGSPSPSGSSSGGSPTPTDTSTTGSPSSSDSTSPAPQG